jgi:hypothetical protein
VAVIKIDKYNSAKAGLTRAGAASAGKSHVQHKTDTVPDDYGKQLLRECRDEFRKADKGKPDLQSEMTAVHYKAIHDAATLMGISSW